MAAPKGNYYYKLRNKNGRDKKFNTPSALLKSCNEYFEWCIENPLKEEQIVNKSWTEILYIDSTDTEGNPIQKEIKKVHPYSIAHLNKLRPFTLEGLCNFIDISLKGFKLYEEREDFIPVTTRARQIIYNQKFEGAATNLLNANIIARDLGLADKQSHSHTVEQPLFPDNPND